ncbi:RseA family anti-sigma factor [Orbaceae bacterium ESL0721]|nr:RseA family anti-sigma factor [Orbaceae bacterium ESL0721]
MQSTVEKEQKERLSSFMDGELATASFIDLINRDENLQACWHRYHIARDAMKGELHDSSLGFDISHAVANAIDTDSNYELRTQPTQDDITPPNLEKLKRESKRLNSFWIQIKDSIAKMSQVGLAACVTLVIIAGVQYYQDESTNSNMPMLNTVPVGVNLAPVGGIADESKLDEQQLFEKRQYDKIRLLVQDYELQKRLNAH